MPEAIGVMGLLMMKSAMETGPVSDTPLFGFSLVKTDPDLWGSSNL
jgi:hypothetical protein